MRIVVVGGGMQGRVIAQNLCARPEKPQVTITDIREPSALPVGVQFQKSDILDHDQSRCKTVLKDADAVVLAVPSEISHAALTNIIRVGKPVVDVSFTPDPPLDLNGAAQASGACCVVDCGIAPGLSHILIGRAFAELGGLDSVRILVGGIPQQPPQVFRHAVYYNPNDLFAEYVRPARARKGGSDFAPAPMDVPFEPYVDSELGGLEAFLSDGLRSLLTSYPDVADMTELTLRWPGHLDTMRNLYAMGLFDDTAAFNAIIKSIATRYAADAYPDVMLLVVEAKYKTACRSWRLLDRRTDGLSSMSRTTGFTTAAVAMALARKQFTEPGVHPPERLGRDENLTKAIIADLVEHGIGIGETTLVQR